MPNISLHRRSGLPSLAAGARTFFVAAGVAIMLVSFVRAPQIVNAESPEEDTLMKASGAPVYYYHAASRKRYVFPNEKTYFTWYDDFSGVQEISDRALAVLPLGGNVTYRPGLRLVKVTTDPKVYAVDRGGTLRWVTTEGVARSLYGPSWGQHVDDLPDAFFTNYRVGDSIQSPADFTPARVTAATPIIAVDLAVRSTPPTPGPTPAPSPSPAPTPVPIPAPAPPGTPNITNARSPLGTNLSPPARWETEIPVIDSIKMSEGWTVNFENPPALDLDANGWLRSLPRGVQSVDVFIHGHNAKGNFPSGKYVVTYQGEGTIEYEMDATKDAATSRPGRDVVDVTATPGGGIVLKITATDPKRTGNYLRNIRVIQPGGRCGGDPFSYAKTAADCSQGNFRSFEQDYDQNILHPEFLQNLRAFSTVRFMAWLGTMYNPVGRWSERTTLQSAFGGDSQGKAAPWEIAIDIANAIDADAWVNIPYHGDDDYVQQAARLTLGRLEPGRRVILEYTNEVWNTVMPYEKGGAWIQRQAEAAWPRDPEEGFNKRLSWYGKRSVEICRIWKREWGADARRITCTMGGQSGWDDISEKMLDCPVWARNGGKRCADEMDALAVAPYFGQPYDAAGVAHLRRLMREPDGGFTKFFDEIERDGLMKATMEGNKRIAQQRGLPLIAYEGGQHFLLSYEVDDENQYGDVQRFLTAVNRHPRMKQAYLTYLKNWKNAGGQLFVHCCATAQAPSIYGFWGLKERQDEPRSAASKFDAVMEFIERNPRWW